MTDEAVESAAESKEQVAPPAPQVSEASRQEPSAPSGVTEDTLKQMFSDFENRMNESLERQVQSQKDKRFARIEKDLESLRNIRERLEANQGDWSALEREAVENEYLSRLDQIESQLSKPQSGGANWEQEWAQQSEAMLKDAADKYGVNLTPEEMAAVSGRTYESYSQAFGALNDVILAKARGEAVPRAAIVPDSVGQTSPPPGDVDTLTNKLQQLIKDQAPVAEINAIREELTRAVYG